MPPDPSPRSHRRASPSIPDDPRALLAHALLLGGATVAVFLAGKPQQGALGVFLLFAGVALIVCPPRVAVEWRLWIVSGLLVGGSALSLLPEHLLTQPAWRRTLDAAPAITMPGTISVSPASTVFWLAVLTLSLLTGLFALAQPIRSRSLLIFALAGALVAGLYAALAIYAKQTGWRYPFASDATFGFFPNRNHTATLLFVGALLALGVLGVVLREGRWVLGLLAGAAMAVCGAALVFYSPSRGGIVFLLAGVFLWIAGLGRRNLDTRLVVSFVAVLLAGGLLFLVSGGEVRDRLLGKTPPPAPPAAFGPALPPTASPSSGDSDDAMHNLTTDFRIKIYRDTFDALRDFPLTGMGLGTFALVFPQYRHASLVEAPVIHPESDWLMLVAEAGTPAALCLLLLLVLAARRLLPEREHPYWPLRWGCAAAAGAAALHGLIDVPVHRAPLGWWLLVVAGLALQSARTGLAGCSRAQHALFVTGGVAALVLGVVLVRAQWFGGTALPPFATNGLQDRVYQIYQRKDIEGARQLAARNMRDFPMFDPVYFQFGAILLNFADIDAEVDAAFGAQRLVSPVAPDIPFRQGEMWFPYDPDRTAALWLEALARQQRILVADGRRPEGALPFYQNLIERAAARPEVQTALWNASRQNVPEALLWLETANPTLVSASLAQLNTDESFLRRLDQGERKRFLLVWYAHGDRNALQRFVTGRPDWEAAVWPLRLRAMLDARQFEQAVRSVCQRDGISLTLPEPAPAERPADENTVTGQDGDDVPAQFASYWRAGNTVAARRVVTEAVASANGSRSAELWRLKAALSAHYADWDSAWRALEQSIRLTRPDELP